MDDTTDNATATDNTMATNNATTTDNATTTEMSNTKNNILLLSLVSIIGILFLIFVLNLLNNFGGADVMNSSAMMGTTYYDPNMNMYMFAPMPNGTTDIQQRLTEIKSMISIGMPLAISIGVINFFKSSVKEHKVK